jgi:hypothetical protein
VGQAGPFRGPAVAVTFQGERPGIECNFYDRAGLCLNAQAKKWGNAVKTVGTRIQLGTLGGFLAMIPLHKRVIVRRSAGICMALLATGPFAATVHAEDYAKSFSVSNRAKVHVETNDGSVSVTTGDTQQVEFRVEYHGYVLSKNLTIESRQQGDEVELTARIPHGWHFSLGEIRRLHIEVRMPKDADLQVGTGDGSLKATGLSGTIDLHTGDGSLTVNSQGCCPPAYRRWLN